MKSVTKMFVRATESVIRKLRVTKVETVPALALHSLPSAKAPQKVASLLCGDLQRLPMTRPPSRCVWH
jgi:hypothetical protein